MIKRPPNLTSGKAYANKKPKEERPEGDFYATPRSLVWVAEDIIKEEFSTKYGILEPACGEGDISQELTKMGYTVTSSDLYKGDKNIDYLRADWGSQFIITNPPFSLWDEFVIKAKTHCQRFMFLGRLNYFGTHSRNESGLWDHLKYVLPFDRYVDFQTPCREDGKFHVGAMATAWFIWDMTISKVQLPKLEVLNVQKYATLGAFKKGLRSL